MSMNSTKQARNSFSKQIKGLTKALTNSVATIRQDIGGLCGMNKEEINKNKLQIDDHSKDLEEGRKERLEMKEDIKKLQSEMEDQKRGRSRSIVVVTGAGVPKPLSHEDPFKVAKDLVFKVTGLNLEKNEIKTCHRAGPSGANMLVDFLFTGPGSTLLQVINPQHKAESYKQKIWLNLHQPQCDRKLFFTARSMVKAGEIDKAFVNEHSTTVVVKNKRKTLILKRDDFRKVTSKDISEFEGKNGK
jgi:hypothetical protein